MSPHEPFPDDYEPISKLILNLDLNDEGEKEEEEDNLPPYQIVGVDMEGNAVPFPEPPWDLKQLLILIFENQDVFLLMPNEQNSHLYPMVSVSFQQTVGNVPPHNENEAFIPEF